MDMQYMMMDLQMHHQHDINGWMDSGRGIQIGGDRGEETLPVVSL
jgi:hypothetical protein